MRSPIFFETLSVAQAATCAPVSGEAGASFLVDSDVADKIAHRSVWLHCGYPITKIKSRRVFVHHLAMPKRTGMSVDHINGNRLDCRRSNLRYCTREQNGFNRSISKNNTSGYKGVFRFDGYKDGPRWRAMIRCGKKLQHLGLYLDKREAAMAYNAAAQNFFGQFARLNEV